VSRSGPAFCVAVAAQLVKVTVPKSAKNL
jgi:hypothetical protein